MVQRALIRCVCLAAWLLLPSLVSAQMVTHTVAIATDGSGNATAYTPQTFGVVFAIRYVPNATTPLTGTADITITDNVTGLGIVTITDVGVSARDFVPQMVMVSTTGVTSVYAASGTNVLSPIPVANAIKVTVAQGGATTLGTIYIYVQGR